jgi:hypothetical protein
MTETNENNFDVAIIGGGPAGMMSAIRAGQLGKKVVLLEKNENLGNKLLLTGGSRCNLSNATFNEKELASKYGKEGFFLLHALSVFGPEKTIGFFNKSGLKTKVEKEGKVYCATNKASDVLKVLIYLLRNNEVIVQNNAKIKEIQKKGNKISKIILDNNKEIIAKKYIIATGGKSYPHTGSTGDGYKFAEKLGHKIETLKPALVPIKIKEEWVKKAQGLSLADAKLDVYLNQKKNFTASGEIMFTHYGLSGPAILSISERVGDLLEKGNVKIALDLNSNLTAEALDKIIQNYFEKNIKKTLKNCLTEILPSKLIPIIIEVSKTEATKKANQITKEERQRLVSVIKKLEMTVTELLGYDQAMITTGGILLKDIDAKTMRSKIIENLFFAGEIINLHGPSGGYNLQACWSTGYLAGQSATK